MKSMSRRQVVFSMAALLGFLLAAAPFSSRLGLARRGKARPEKDGSRAWSARLTSRRVKPHEHAVKRHG
jgi:hypothetical protein